MRSFLVLALCAVLTACGPGEQGPTGPQGPRGEPGPSVGVNKATIYRCSGVIAIEGLGRAAVHHDAYIFPDGGMMTECLFNDGALSTSSFALYHSGSSDTANCALTRDLDTASAGFWNYNLNATRTSSVVLYEDPASPRHLSRYTVPCTRIDP